MLGFLSNGLIILTISFVACFWVGDSGLAPLDNLDELVGKADPKFKCEQLCETRPKNQCISNGTPCGSILGLHCGDSTLSIYDLKECVEDDEGNVDPCQNLWNKNCYIIIACQCDATADEEGNLSFDCVLSDGRNQFSGPVVSSPNCN